MSKHTPGPWEAHDEGCNCLFIRGQVPVNEGATSRERQYYSSIATVTQRDQHPRLGGGIDRSVTAANARLIAAAPELLSGLNAMLTHMGMDEDEWNKPTFDQARAAIAKATGAAQ